MRNRIFFRLMAAFLLVIAAVALTLDFSVRRSWEESLRHEIERNLSQKTLMLANRVNTDRQHTLQEIATEESRSAGARVTVIDVQGKVLADSEAAPESMENHAGRPEFVAALGGSVGTNERKSHTLGIPFLYVAAPISGGAVRLAYPLSDIEATTSGFRRTLIFGSTVALVIAILLSAIAAEWTARRLNRIMRFADEIAAGNLTARIDEQSTDEIGSIALSLDKTAQYLQNSILSLQESQRQLETLLNSMRDAVIAVGPDDRVQWANLSMDKLVPQRTRLKAAVVETVRDPDFLQAVRTASESREVCTTRATSILVGRTFEVTAAPLPGGGSVAVLRDLTETERVEKTRRDFIANVSHELRTPLTSIQGYTETLLDTTSESDSTREFLEIIRKNAMRMSRLTEDLLTLARVESGEQRFDMQPVTSEEILQEAVQNFREIARTYGIELEVADRANGVVIADRESINQVLSNLIENALKYGSSGKLLILGTNAAQDGIEFYVRDFGPGIPYEHLKRLFERFYRVDKARSRESGGTGLGLAIAKHIVMAHGGTIRAESELNHGSTFLFTLPTVSQN